MGPDPATLFRPLDLSRRKVVAAVSGGSDSLALLLLLHDFLPRADGLLAVTVDHRLRPEAAAEARAVKALCRGLGVRHRTMAWEGDKPGTGLIAAAREARHDLLAAAAQDFGADIVLTAHTMDDQAETVAMRGRRGEGPGLAGMADATLFDGRVWIVRPLLGVRRQALRDLLAARGASWIDDPSNDNRAFERVRVRAALRDGEVEELAARAAAEGAARTALSDAAALLVERFASRPAPGLFRLEPDALSRAPDDDAALVHALRALLAVAGGTPHLPDRQRVEELVSKLRLGPLRATLSRAVVDARRSGIWIRREARGLPSAQPCPPAFDWDGRWRIACAVEASGLTVAPLGIERAGRLAPDFGGAPESLARAALSLEPGLFAEEEFVACAAAPEAARRGVSARPLAAPFARYLPAFDLALARATMRLAGAAVPPASPWKHHIEAGR